MMLVEVERAVFLLFVFFTISTFVFVSPLVFVSRIVSIATLSSAVGSSVGGSFTVVVIVFRSAAISSSIWFIFSIRSVVVAVASVVVFVATPTVTVAVAPVAVTAAAAAIVIFIVVVSRASSIRLSISASVFVVCVMTALSKGIFLKVKMLKSTKLKVLLFDSPFLHSQKIKSIKLTTEDSLVEFVGIGAFDEVVAPKIAGIKSATAKTHNGLCRVIFRLRLIKTLNV